MELLGALAPALTDTLLRWTQTAASYLAGGAADRAAKPTARKARQRRTSA